MNSLQIRKLAFGFLSNPKFVARGLHCCGAAYIQARAMPPKSKFGPSEAKVAAYATPFVLLALLLVVFLVSVLALVERLELVLQSAWGL